MSLRDILEELKKAREEFSKASRRVEKALESLVKLLEESELRPKAEVPEVKPAAEVKPPVEVKPPEMPKVPEVAPPTPPTPPAPPPPEIPEAKRVLFFRDFKGRSLAKLMVYDDRLELLPEEGVRLAMKPDVRRILVDQFLEGWRIRSQEEEPESPMDYEIAEEGGFLEKLVVRNYHREAMVDKFASLLRWAVRKMAK